MTEILNQLRRYLCCCLNCGSFLPSDGCLCVECKSRLCIWEKVLEDKSPRGLLVRTLYRWAPGRSDVLSKLVLWLKGPRQKEAWAYYAKEMSRRYCEVLPSGVKIYIVPAPARGDKKDHARFWAEGLGRALGAEVLPCLKKSQYASQRGSDRGTRALIEMELIEKYTDSVDFSSQVLWIFADDIVTTGATARAAHITLGSPQHFEVWAFAQRSLSCGASSDLL